MTSGPFRRIQSFMRREGRMSEAQRAAFARLWPRYGTADDDAALDLDALFGRRAPRVLEIGFGNGDNLAALALAHPERDFLGIEVYRTGAAHLLGLLDAQGSTNVRVLCADAVATLERRLADGSFRGACIFFPDPWPKRRHHKRRLIQPAFASLLARKVEPGGEVLLATDWEDYARQMLAVMDAEPAFENAAGPGMFSPRSTGRPVTKFERRGHRLGHGVWDLAYRRR